MILNGEQLKPVERTFAHESFGEVTLICRQPTREELIKARAFLRDEEKYCALTLKVLSGWKGVEDGSGNPAPFTDQNLCVAFSKAPSLLHAACEFTSAVFFPPKRAEQLGNSSAPPASSLLAATPESQA